MGAYGSQLSRDLVPPDSTPSKILTNFTVDGSQSCDPLQSTGNVDFCSYHQ